METEKPRRGSRTGFRSIIRRRWRWMSIGLGIGAVLGCMYAFWAAPIAFSAGYNSHGWGYRVWAIVMVILAGAMFYYLAWRQERDLDDAE